VTNHWPGLIAMSIVLVIAMILVAWGAFTLGNPRRPYPRRPLPYPRHKRNPAHAVPNQAIKPHLASGYVTTRKLRSWTLVSDEISKARARERSHG
jgi:hypothetical protein